MNIAVSMLQLGRFDEAKNMLRVRLLPAARHSLGADHDVTLELAHRLAAALVISPKRSRGGPRLNRRARFQRAQ